MLARPLAELSKMRGVETPVVSLYLATRWNDQHQRERARVFVAHEVRRARHDTASRMLAADLDWVEHEAMAFIAQDREADARGLVLFACSTAGLRDVVPLRVACADRLVVADAPYIRPLVGALADCPRALVVWLDAERARLITVTASAEPGDEVLLEHDVPGHHRRGGWALLAQSRYQRHIAEQRMRHVDAVAQTIAQLVDGEAIERVVVSGEAEIVATLHERLPSATSARVLRGVRASRFDSTADIVARAVDLVGAAERQTRASAVDELIVEAAKGGRAVVGLVATLDAVLRGAVHRLYLLDAFDETGVACRRCEVARTGFEAACARCGEPTRVVELGEELVERVIESGGSAATLARHDALASLGGVAASLRYRV